MTNTRQRHGSTTAHDRLSSGQARDFRTAMLLLMLACEEEQRHARRNGCRESPGMEAYAATAKQALAIYDRHIGAAEKAALAEMRRGHAGDSDMSAIADVLESREYSALAF